MNSLKKSEGFPLLNFEEVPGILLLNFEGGPGVPFLNFRGVPGPRVLVPLLQHAFFNTAIQHLSRNSLKHYYDGVRFLVNLHVTLSNFELLLWKFKYFITALKVH